MESHFSLLVNGLDFLLDSANKLLSANKAVTNEFNKKRLVKYALLHSSSGIELVLKYRLFQEHWTYVFADMNKAKKEALNSGAFKSVDSETIIERLENLCDVSLSREDKLGLKNLRKKRNRVEHFDFVESIRSIENSIHNGISILIKIMASYNSSSFSETEKRLYNELKEAMRQMTEHYNDVKSLAQKEIKDENMQDYVTVCPDCGEKFLICDDEVRCVFCGYSNSAELAAEDYVNNIMEMDAYSTIKDGGEFPLYECPECGRETFVVNGEKGKAICFSCNFDCDINKISFCNDCGRPYLSSSEHDEIGICHSCAQYRFNKDD